MMIGGKPQTPILNHHSQFNLVLMRNSFVLPPPLLNSIRSIVKLTCCRSIFKKPCTISITFSGYLHLVTFFKSGA